MVLECRSYVRFQAALLLIPAFVADLLHVDDDVVETDDSSVAPWSFEATGCSVPYEKAALPPCSRSSVCIVSTGASARGGGIAGGRGRVAIALLHKNKCGGGGFDGGCGSRTSMSFEPAAAVPVVGSSFSGSCRCKFHSFKRVAYRPFEVHPVISRYSCHDDTLTPSTATILDPSGAPKPDSTSQMVMF